MPNRYVVTFVGEDRTGIVKEVSEIIARHGGNWMESRLSQLEGAFAGLILMGKADREIDALKTELEHIPGGSWQVDITPVGRIGAPVEANLTLAMIGPDRPGIVHEVSAALAEAGINVLTMETAVESAPFTGELLFKAQIGAQVPADVPTERLQEKLDEIADAMTLDIELESG